MIDAIMSCCGMQQWTSAEMMIGYGETTKAYFAIASQALRKGTFVVNVLPW
jgi:hypothetical protein